MFARMQRWKRGKSKVWLFCISAMHCGEIGDPIAILVWISLYPFISIRIISNYWICEASGFPIQIVHCTLKILWNK
jgi:hypothetical protein